jgi:signal transduction histidine kinase
VRAPRIALTGEGPRVAANQAAALFALSGALALIGITLDPSRWTDLVVIAVADLGMCAVAAAVPWDRLPPTATLVLTVPALVILAVSTWAFGGVATGTGPFFMLLFAWVGLHFPAWAVFALAPPALVAYTVPLVATDVPPEVLTSGVVLIPIAVGIGLLIGRQVAYQRRARDEVRRIERWRAALTATLAHDVRSPLTSVHAALRQLRTASPDRDTESWEPIITGALRQTARVRRLATGLLDVERVESGGSLKLDRRRIGLRDATWEAVTYLNARTAGGLTVEIPADLVVHVDRQRLEQMLINLTANAMQHGEPPVVIGAHRAGEQVTIEIRDHGPGVAEEHVSGLFERFRGDEPDPELVGLVLWVVQQLARAHGGDVRYEPADPGARFLLTLPDPPPAKRPDVPSMAAAGR